MWIAQSIQLGIGCLLTRFLLAGSAKDFPHVRLSHGFDQHFVDVHMRGAGGDPEQNVRHIRGHERVRARIKVLGFFHVALEAPVMSTHLF